ncbi:MAG TPA: UDP-N-acetylmuramate--L-alanine ligase [Salinivirgaceae bacterium]|nr:UDP-N-acetylmuramate--L-alanine ligase [Salinivirgaceae bacterium]
MNSIKSINIDFSRVEGVYFAGIGGIGMSALARFCKLMGKQVEGYDLNKTHLTEQLESEGIRVIYHDDPELISKAMIDGKTLVVRTPAVSDDLKILTFWRSRDVDIVRRSQMLGYIASQYRLVAVSGTHGKTTVTAMTSHILNQRPQGVNAFIGGITANYQSNLLLSENSDVLVAEADEFDRAFLYFNPNYAVITSIDPDHLDIYQNYENIVNAFQQFSRQLLPGGTLIINQKLLSVLPLNSGYYTYHVNNPEADYFAKDIENHNGYYRFTLVTPDGERKNLRTGVPGFHNLENSIAASALALNVGIDKDALQRGLETFSGVKRRFEVLHHGKEVYIDDYAHHPKEIEACINSARQLFKSQKITVIFQPHLYSRTRDLMDQFAQALSLADEVILLPIYPARELPITGVDSSQLVKKIPKSKYLSYSEVLSYVRNHQFEMLITMGAGDIGELASSIKDILNNRL